MKAENKRQRLTALLASDRCVMAGSVFDPLSARIAEEVGFEVGILGGSIASFTVLGAPDLMLLTLTELAEQTRRICRASQLPVLVDADHGYGNALSVMRTVEELASAGASGLSIEDTLLPRAFGSTQDARLTSLEEGVGRMRAAGSAARLRHFDSWPHGRAGDHRCRRRRAKAAGVSASRRRRVVRPLCKDPGAAGPYLGRGDIAAYPRRPCGRAHRSAVPC